MVLDGGQLGSGQVSPTVELDEIFRAFDAKTREAFRVWLDQQGRAFAGRGEDINDALGNLAPFAEDTSEMLEILDRHERATQQLVRDTGEVFGALTERQGQLQQLIVNSNRLFDATAARRRGAGRDVPDPPDLPRRVPRHDGPAHEFANDTNPLVTQLRPAARELSPTLISLAGLAPDLKAFFRDLDPLITVSKKGLPGAGGLPQRHDAPARADRSVPATAQPDPRLPRPLQARDHRVLRERRGVDPGDRAGRSAETRRSTTAHDEPREPREPRCVALPDRDQPLEPVLRAARLPEVKTGLEVLDDYYCTNNAVPSVSPLASPLVPQELRDQIQDFVYGGLERQRRPALQGAGAARAEAHRHARRIPACRSCARALGVS